MLLPPHLQPGDELTRPWLNWLLQVVARCRIRLGTGCGLAMVQTDRGTYLRVLSQQGGQLAYTNSIITARSGTTAGTGTVYLVTDEVVSGVMTLTTGSVSTPVWNYSATSGGVPDSKYCWLQTSPAGNLVVVSAEC